MTINSIPTRIFYNSQLVKQFKTLTLNYSSMGKNNTIVFDLTVN
jgi:hypothetical protein